ncbi:MAG TPA: RdgB/HAM1 family non-canonical purine NTP pyrophosphatase [Thermoguttaceae bacterium]|nr:RdgB/HAM1 family non-canonical purine NTP pyrophosphatase [Thermoguttaceae bacterium]
MSNEQCLVLGTSNQKKGGELAALFAPLGLVVRTLTDFPEAIEVNETGATFAENAALKASLQAKHLGRWVLGEDSGLAVDALDGAPGVFSARYSGPGATDASNNAHLLTELGSIPLENRQAHYVCHMTLCDPTGQIAAESEDVCRGRIVFEPRGANGFGYDPLFEIVECHRTFGQLSPAVKACLSHRARAARKLVAEVACLLESGRWR